MKFFNRHFLIVFSLMILTPFFNAFAYKDICDELKNPDFSFDVKYADINYIYNLSGDEIKNQTEQVFRNDSFLRGLTKTNFYKKLEVNLKIIAKGDEACIGLKDLNLDMGFDKIDVYIDKKYKPGDCPFEITKQHENEHVNIHKSILKKHSYKIKNRVNEIIQYLDPMKLNRLPDEELRVKAKEYTEYVNQFISNDHEILKIEADMNWESKSKNEALDSDDSYKRTQRMCPADTW